MQPRDDAPVSGSSRPVPAQLSIVPPSPSAPIPHTPTHQRPSITTALKSPSRLTYSRAHPPTSPSTTHSTTSPLSARPRLSLDVRPGNGSNGDFPPPPLPLKNEKRLPPPPSPHRSSSKGWALGAYDNKLVSSSLSQLPPIPPLSPSGVSSAGSNLSAYSQGSPRPHTQSVTTTPSFTSVNLPSRSSLSLPGAHSGQGLSSGQTGTSIGLSGGGGVIVLPDGTTLSTEGGGNGSVDRNENPTLQQTMAHSSPNSPWSLLTVHVLPVFAGSPLKTPIEDLNVLCNQHIVNTSQRTPTSRLIMTLASDLREFIASGMLTLKAKFDTVEEAKVVSRAAEVWNFFWGQILPYVEGVFLPFAQIRDIQSTSSHNTLPAIATLPIDVRHLLLSGFLLHILLPLLPRLIPLITRLPSILPDPELGPRMLTPGPPDLQRLLQMSLILSTQARYSSFFPTRDAIESEVRDEEARDSVDGLGKAVRWCMAISSSPSDSTTSINAVNVNGTPARPGLQRGLSVNQAGRLRRRGWRASLFHDMDTARSDSLSRHNSETNQSSGGVLPSRWGRPRIDEEDDYELTPQTYSVRPAGSNFTGNLSAATSMAPSTVTSGTTVRAGESVATYTDQLTPIAEFIRRPGTRQRAHSSGSSDLHPYPTGRA